MDFVTLLINFLVSLFQAEFFRKFLEAIGGLACLTLLCVGTAGCAPDSEAIERTANTVIDKVVSAGIAKAVGELTSRAAQLQGQVSGINPGYKLTGFGIFGTGIVWDVTVKLDGVSGNLAGATQAGADPFGAVAPPANREPVTQPEQ